VGLVKTDHKGIHKRLREEVLKLTPLNSKHIFFEKGPGGFAAFVKNLPSAGGGGDTTVVTGVGGVPVLVTGGSGHIYTVSVYANGVDQAATATGQSLYVMQLGYLETIPTGTWLIAATSTLPVYNDDAV
jgi:hypothetical protein